MFLLFLSTLPSHPVGFHSELLPSSDIQSTAAGVQGLIGPFYIYSGNGQNIFYDELWDAILFLSEQLEGKVRLWSVHNEGRAAAV